MNMITKRVDLNTQVFNVIKTVINLKNNPKMAQNVYSLYSGSSDCEINVPYGIVGTGRVERICSLNTFAGLNEDMIDEDNSEEQKFEVTKIFDKNRIESSSGLWILPSFINHSCCPNVHREFYGDVMSLYSTKPIKPDEEITLQYVDYMMPLEERTKCFEGFGFICDCRLCEIYR